jgi:hypothetical protein
MARRRQEPQLPSGPAAEPTTGLEPLLKTDLPAAEAARAVGREVLAKHCGTMTLREWWAKASDPEDLDPFIALGRPTSEARRRRTRIACRFVRSVIHLLGRRIDEPRRCLDLLEHWCDGDEGATPERIREAAHFCVNRMFGFSRPPTNLRRQEWTVAMRTAVINRRVTQAVCFAATLPGRMREAKRGLVKAAAAVVGAAAIAASDDRGRTAGRKRRALTALLRAEYPDPVVALTERLAELRGD